MYTSDTKIVRMHARARGALIECHQFLALLESPKRRRKGTDVQGLGRDVEQVREQSPDLAVEHPYELTPPRNRNAQQLLCCQAECVLLVHRSDVIKPVEIGKRLQIGLVFNQFFCAAMEQTNMRIGAFNDFTIKIQNKPKHPMGSRMLRPKIH